jgi:16S rRNA processing protein RimM
MDEFIYVGKIVNTHGLKGEIRILSDFEKKDKVFIPGMTIYIGRKKEKEVINSYRHHKVFDMITMQGYSDINEIIRYKGLYVYVKKEDLKLDDNDYLLSDLIDLDVYIDNNKVGIITDVRDSGNNKFIVVKTEEKEVFVPLQVEFIKKVDLSTKTVIIEPIKGMF